MSDVTERRDVWLVLSNTDCTEGRGREYVKYVTETEATAIRLGLKGYVMGSNCPVVKGFAVKINNTWFAPCEIRPPSKEDTTTQERIDRQRAAHQKAIAAGLTDEDIKALGKSHE